MAEISNEAVAFFELEDEVSWSEEIPKELPVSRRTYSSIYFRAHSKKNVYSLDPYKLTDFLGDLGGFL